MPKINNFIIICCRKSYLNVCSNSHIPVVKLLNNSSKKNKAEMNITPVMHNIISLIGCKFFKFNAIVIPDRKMNN